MSQPPTTSLVLTATPLMSQHQHVPSIPSTIPHIVSPSQPSGDAPTVAIKAELCGLSQSIASVRGSSTTMLCFANLLQRPGPITRSVTARGARPSTPIDLTLDSPISVEEDGLKFKISRRDHDEHRKARQSASLAFWRAEIMQIEAEIQATQTRLEYAQQEYEAILKEVSGVALASTDGDGEPRAKRTKPSRGKGGKTKMTTSVATISSASKGKEKARTDVA